MAPTPPSPSRQLAAAAPFHLSRTAAAIVQNDDDETTQSFIERTRHCCAAECQDFARASYKRSRGSLVRARMQEEEEEDDEPEPPPAAALV